VPCDEECKQECRHVDSPVGEELDLPVAVVNEIVVSLQKEYIPHDKARHYSVCEEQLLADAASLQGWRDRLRRV